MAVLTEKDCRVIRDRLRNHLVHRQHIVKCSEPTARVKYDEVKHKLAKQEVDDTLKALSLL